MKYELKTWCPACEKEYIIVSAVPNHNPEPQIYCIMHKDNPTVLQILLMTPLPEAEEGQTPVTA